MKAESASSKKPKKKKRGGRVFVKFLKRGWQLIVATARRFFDSRSLDHAGALSFFLLLSLAPLTILLVSAAGYVAYFLGPESDFIESVTSQLVLAVHKIYPIEGERVQSLIKGLIKRRNQAGFWGFVVLIVGASMAFGSLENAIRSVFQVEKSRRYIVSRAIFTIVVIALIATLFVGQHALMIIDSLSIYWGGVSLEELLNRSIFFDSILVYLPVPLTFMLLLYAPGVARPKLKYGFAGAVLFTVLWELARGAYVFYVTQIAEFGKLYGSLAAPLLLILWTFYAMIILLLAMCFTAVLATKDSEKQVS
jgi:membrane protein